MALITANTNLKLYIDVKSTFEVMALITANTNKLYIDVKRLAHTPPRAPPLLDLLRAPTLLDPPRAPPLLDPSKSPSPA